MEGRLLSKSLAVISSPSIIPVEPFYIPAFLVRHS
jgi:hypothetical protein